MNDEGKKKKHSPLAHKRVPIRTHTNTTATMRPPGADPLADLLPELQPAPMSKQRQQQAQAQAPRPTLAVAPVPAVPTPRPPTTTPPTFTPSSLRSGDAFASLTGGGGGDGKGR
jgi:hypothetical protein